MRPTQLLLNTLILAASLVFMPSCQKENTKLAEVKLQADTEAILVEVYNEEKALTLTWNSAAKNGTAPNYFVEITTGTNLEFTSSVIFPAENATSLTLTNQELKSVHTALGINSDYTLTARVRAEADGFTQVISNKVNIAVTLDILPVIERLWVLGGATNAGWSLGAMPEMENNGGIFTWTGHLKDAASAGGVRFNTINTNWFPSLTLVEAPSTSGKLMYMASHIPDKYIEFSVEVAGTYKLTIDARNFKNMTYTCELVEAD